MTKILMRAGMSPFDNYNGFEMITQNPIGNNLGNLVFPYSMFRTLMTPDTQIDTILTETFFTPKQIDYFNSEYDFLVLPFANALRENFKGNLKKLTFFINALKIPCIISGIGFQGNLNGSLNTSEKYDKVAYKFLKSILNKSAIIGVRGEITAKYLVKLGFREEIDFTVIGCPSLYLYGDSLPIANINELTPDSHVSMNGKINLPDSFHRFFRESIKNFNNYHYVPQVLDEIRQMYVGIPHPKNKYKKTVSGFPISLSDEVYLKNHAISFTNVPTWLNYFKTKQFSFGSRIHGNIAGILGGVPSFIIVSDSRTLELAKFHNIPYITVNDLTENTNIFTLYNQTDFNTIHTGHKERFNHYIDFLNKNNLPHIYTESGTIVNSIFDQKIDSIHFHKPLHTFFSLPNEEQAILLNNFFQYYIDNSNLEDNLIQKTYTYLKKNLFNS